ncbi:MAG: hypothetical protein QNJ56_02380 [Gammaproteobacteria bacterium]|nr:hypothetical protein [Gammaproteobacteria bacterium]
MLLVFKKIDVRHSSDNNHGRLSPVVFILTMVLILGTLGPGFSKADVSAPIRCHVTDTDDVFIVYPPQLAFSSDRFYIFQLMNGLTVLIINRDTGRFNRLSNLNLLAHSTVDPFMHREPIQFFSGTCEMIIDD